MLRTAFLFALLSAGVAHADPDTDARAALALAAASAAERPRAAACDCDPCVCEPGRCRCDDCPCGPADPCNRLGYRAAQAKALAEGKPVVVFCGQEARPVTGCITCRVAGLEGLNGPCVVVGRPADGRLCLAASLPGRPGDATIRAAAFPAPPVAYAQPPPAYAPAPAFFGGGFRGGCLGGG